MERNYYNEIEKISREKLKGMIITAYQVQCLYPWYSHYSEELNLETLEDARSFVRCLIDFMLEEKYMIDMVQDVVYLYCDEIREAVNLA